MCLIIDVNTSGDFQSGDFKPLAKIILNWLTDKNGMLVFGGRYSNELSECSGSLGDFVLRMWRSGKAQKVPDELVNEMEQVFIKSKLLKSDDPHIVALAKVSGARLLYSRDNKLRDDFKNKKILKSPRGKIIQNKEHEQLLRQSPRCRRSY